MKKSNTKVLMGLILAVAGFLGVVVCAIMSIVLQFMNPDMTELRLFLTYPWPTIGCFTSLIVCWIGYVLIGK